MQHPRAVTLCYTCVRGAERWQLPGDRCMAPGGEDPRPRKQPRKRGTAVLLSRGRPRRLYIYMYICGKLHVIAGHLFATVHSLLSVTQLPSTFLFFHPTFSSSPISPRPFSSPLSHTHIYTQIYVHTIANEHEIATCITLARWIDSGFHSRFSQEEDDFLSPMDIRRSSCCCSVFRCG